MGLQMVYFVVRFSKELVEDRKRFKMYAAYVRSTIDDTFGYKAKKGMNNDYLLENRSFKFGVRRTDTAKRFREWLEKLDFFLYDQSDLVEYGLWIPREPKIIEIRGKRIRIKRPSKISRNPRDLIRQIS